MSHRLRSKNEAGRMDRELSEDSIKHANKARNDLGMSLLSTKNRSCLNCNRTFWSTSSNHRLCYRCGGRSELVL